MSRGNSFWFLLGLIVCWLVASSAAAQGVLIVTDSAEVVRLPRPIVIYHPMPPIWPPPHPPFPPHPVPTPPELPPATYKISEISINTRLADQVAKVQVSQSFVNTGSRQLEASFIFPLPYEGAIEQMTLMVDGKEHPARLLKAEEARRLYEEIVRKNRDPALLEWIGSGLFKTSVFPIPPGAKRTITLKYSQLCRKTEGLTDFLFPLSTAKYTSHAVENVEIRVAVESQDEIKNVYSPTHAIEIKRPDERHATVSYVSKNEVPSSDFRLLYDVGKGKVSTRVLSYRPKADDDGFFLLLASPEIKAPDQSRAKKTVQLVIDRSGSMSGKKIEQVRAALKFVLNNLREGDLFNVIAYDSQVEAFRPELQRFNEENRKAAIGFVEGLYAGGSTNIDGALKTTLAQLQDPKQPSYVFFLTDGLPTTGETNEMKIVANAKESAKVKARLFAFGVGYDVNARLLERLARDSFGQAEYVRPNEDIEDRISRLYRRVESPILTDVGLVFDLEGIRAEDGKAVNRVYPHGSFDLFAGEQMVVVGRYKKPGTAKVVVTGKIGDREQKFDFPAELVAKSSDESCAFIEKIWAMRRVGEIIDEIDLKGKNDELLKELVDLSMRHGILTPYTSFFADENVNLRDTASNMRRADSRLNDLADTSGYGGVAQRAMRQSLEKATTAPAAADATTLGLSMPAEGRIGGAGPMSAAKPASPPVNYSWAGDADREQQSAQQNVRNIGNRAFYKRGGQWIDGTLGKDQEAKPQRIKQFSEPYFEMVRRHGRTVSQYLVFDEPLLLNVDGQAYLIEP